MKTVDGNFFGGKLPRIRMAQNATILHTTAPFLFCSLRSQIICSLLLLNLWCYAVLVCLYCLNCTKSGQSILWKIIYIVATICRILRPKCTKFDFDWGFVPDPAGELTTLPQAISWIQGVLRPRGGKREEEKRERRKGKKGDRRKKGKGEGKNGRMGKEEGVRVGGKIASWH